MTQRKRVSLGQLRYPTQQRHSDNASEYHQSRTAWMFAMFELDYVYDLLIDLKSGYAATEKARLESGVSQAPLPTESEVHDCLQKTLIQDYALQQATKRLPHPYRRKYAPLTKIIVRNMVYKAIREQLDEGVSPDPMWRGYDLFRVVEAYGGALPKTVEDYNRDIELALEIDKQLHLKKHPDLKPETRRISALVRESLLVLNDWDHFLWSDFLDSVFTYSARFTCEVVPASVIPNKPSPRQKASGLVTPDTQILRRIQRKSAQSVSRQIGHAYFSDEVIEELLQNIENS